MLVMLTMPKQAPALSAGPAASGTVNAVARQASSDTPEPKPMHAGARTDVARASVLALEYSGLPQRLQTVALKGWRSVQLEQTIGVCCLMGVQGTLSAA
jgi:hypothetical protein